MANPLDTDIGSELFSSYEAELKLVQADLNQKLDQIAELTGEPRKSAAKQAERSLEEAAELVRVFSRSPPFVAEEWNERAGCQDCWNAQDKQWRR